MDDVQLSHQNRIPAKPQAVFLTSDSGKEDEKPVSSRATDNKSLDNKWCSEKANDNIEIDQCLDAQYSDSKKTVDGDEMVARMKSLHIEPVPNNTKVRCHKNATGKAESALDFSRNIFLISL